MDPILTGAAANLASDATKGILQEAKRHVKYITNYKKNVEKLDKKIEFLKAKVDSVQLQVDAAGRNVETIMPDVELWRDRAFNTIDEEEKEVKALKEKAKAKRFMGFLPDFKHRYQLGKKAEKDMADLNELIQDGRFTKIAIRDVPQAPTTAPKDFEDFVSRKVVFDDIMEALEDSTISMIGVYGTGGMGKTRLVKEVVRQVNRSGKAVFAKVSVNPDIVEIQFEIAEQLGLTLVERTIPARARLLRARLQQETKILVVLDDIWKKLDLDEVGVPYGDQHKGCKILMTSRAQNVLTNEMEANKTIPIGVLKEKEAWDLFRKIAGPGNDFENLKLQQVAAEVAKRCAGLPLAITTIARALRYKDLPVWNDALLQLERPSAENFEGMPGAVYEAIHFSYKNLKSDGLRQTFLLCCLLGNNANNGDLLICAMGLKIYDGRSTVEETENRMLTMVSDLKDSGFLLHGYGPNIIAMHDFICDVGLAIAFRDNHAFALKHGDSFKGWPHEERREKLEMISLSFTSIIKLPPKLECPQLTLLSMGTSSRDSYVEMPTSFFEKMKKLRVLNLIRMDFSSSPSSIIHPTSLRTLSLMHCKLGQLANLGELQNLEILSLFGSDIKMLPKEIGQLTELKYLDLSLAESTLIIRPGVLSCLSSLEELYMVNVLVQWNQPNSPRLDELLNKKLTALYIRIPEANAKRLVLRKLGKIQDSDRTGMGLAGQIHKNPKTPGRYQHRSCG